MPSETDCLNDALSQIGASRITAIDDGSTNANHCTVFYPSLRDGMIRSAKWNFSLERVALALDATAPAFEFAYRYALPADCLRVWQYFGGSPAVSTVVTDPNAYSIQPRYKIEGRYLLSNDGQAYILYGKRVTNPSLWDSLFYQTLTTWLASKLASAIMKDPKMSNALLDQAINVLLPQALSSDGQENSVEPFITDDLLWGRVLA